MFVLVVVGGQSLGSRIMDRGGLEWRWTDYLMLGHLADISRNCGITVVCTYDMYCSLGL